MATQNAIDTSKPIGVDDGGTGAVTLTDGGVLVGSGVGAITALAVGGTGELLVGAVGADPAFGTSATGDFTFTRSAVGTRIVNVISLDNTTATSHAYLDVSSGGASGGDPKTVYTVTGETTFATGIDNSDADKFKISANADLGTTDVFVCTTDGEITMPLQSAFGAVAATQSNVTGDGTTYTVTFGSAEYFDQNNDFDGTSTFTAPVDGKYQFNADVGTDDLTSSHTDGNITLSTSNRDYTSSIISPAGGRTASESLSFQISMLVDMDAADTAVIKLTVSNDTKVVDVIGSWTFFNGYLAC